MSSDSQAELREATSRLERELLARLGLGSGASNEQIENAHEAIAEYLDRSPAGLRAWSARQAASIDEAYALLRGDRADLAAVAARQRGGAPETPDTPVAARPASPAGLAGPAPKPASQTPTNRIVTPHGGRHAMDALDDSGDDWLETGEVPVPPKRKTPAAARREAIGAASGARRVSPMLKRAGLVAAAVVAALAIGFTGYTLGSPGSTPAPTTDPQVAAFQEQVASLMQKLAANPDDVETLAALGNLYYQAGDYQTALTWIDKVLALDPSQVDSLLARGAANFNLGDYATAEESWKQVLQLDAENVEAYYDLGFLYFSDNPPNVEKTKEMWGKVVELSPDSSIAQTVASHLQSLDALASGSPTTDASGAPAGGESPAAEASGAPSAEPSAVPTEPAASASPAASAGG